ncbi:MAG: hypothetical protein IKJ43_00605 [Bacilli bacterium]|nr:hypothetical protein [Bacilli bacterium]
MKNKILVNVYAITINEYFDIFIPINTRVGDALDLICSTIKGMTECNFPIDQGLALLDSETGKFYNLDTAINETGMKNGRKLILFNY